MSVKIDGRLTKIVVCTLLVLVSSAIFLVTVGQSISTILDKTIVLWSLFVLIVEVWCSAKIAKTIFVPSLFFLMTCYLFQNGQLLLYVLGINFNDYYLNIHKELMHDVIVYSSVSAMLAGYAALLTIQKKEKGIYRWFRHINKYERGSVSFAAYIGIIITGIIALPLVMIKFRYSLIGGYGAVREFEATIPQIIGVFEYMYIPFSVLGLIYEQTIKKRKLIYILLCIFFILTALCGDRTTGIAGLFIVSFINYKKTKLSKIEKRKASLKLFVSFFSISAFVQVARAFRSQTSILNAIFGNSSILVQLIQEIGFSCFPLFTMMNIVPQHESFLYGKTYLFSFIGGMIPSFLDPSGTISWINSQAHIFETWQSMYYGQYKFGFGFSLNAEAYINFGWFGLIAIFIVYLVIMNWLRNIDYSQNTNLFSQYSVSVLLYSWLTLSRRDTYYIWQPIFYCIIIVMVYLNVMTRRRRD